MRVRRKGVGLRGSRRKTRLFSALALLLASCAKQAPPAPLEPKAPVEAVSSVDRAVATTGDVIAYSVTVDYDSAYTVEIPEPGAEIAGFRITDLGREEPKNVGARVIEERWYKLRADLVGSYVLPPVTVTYSTAQEGVQEAAPENGQGEESAPPAVASVETVQTSAIFVEVESVLPGDGEGEATDIRNVKPLREAVSPIPWAWIIGGAIGFLALLIAFLAWRRRPAKVIPLEPPHQIAFRELNTLRGTDFTDPEAVRRFHFRISEIVRTYVEDRFGLNATDLTTEEIVALLPNIASLLPQQRQQLEVFLEATDRVKFADYGPPEDEIGATYDRALSFVETTRPTEDMPAAEPAPESSPPAQQQEAA